jgi:hypothetical protein
MGDSRQKAEITKAILKRHFPGGNQPKGLLMDIYKALGEAELRGYADCLRFFEQSHPDNDNSLTT